MPIPSPISSHIKADVDRALSGKFRSLYFSDRLERLFEHETQQARSGHLVAVGILWIVVGFVAAILFQRSGAGSTPFGMNVGVRAGVVTPILAAVVFAVWWGVRPIAARVSGDAGEHHRAGDVILGVMFSNTGDVGANRGALTVVLLFITVVVRLRFWFAVAACLSLVALQVGVPTMLHVPAPGSVPLALVTIAITLAANYTLEREYRLHYLQRLLGRIQGAQLSEMVEQLHELSLRDPLTGLANRRALDELLGDCAHAASEFAVILVDVDAFKAFNDTYGHQIGDDCLRRISAMLRASLRFPTDRVARMGGEEFAVVLPQTTNRRRPHDRGTHAAVGVRSANSACRITDEPAGVDQRGRQRIRRRRFTGAGDRRRGQGDVSSEDVGAKQSRDGVDQHHRSPGPGSRLKRRVRHRISSRRVELDSFGKLICGIFGIAGIDQEPQRHFQPWAIPRIPKTPSDPFYRK